MACSMLLDMVRGVAMQNNQYIARTQTILSSLPSTDTQDLQSIFEHISNDSNAGKLTHLDTLKRFTEDPEHLIAELNTMLKKHNARIERIIDCVYISWRVQA